MWLCIWSQLFPAKACKNITRRKDIPVQYMKEDIQKCRFYQISHKTRIGIKPFKCTQCVQRFPTQSHPSIPLKVFEHLSLDIQKYVTVCRTTRPLVDHYHITTRPLLQPLKISAVLHASLMPLFWLLPLSRVIEVLSHQAKPSTDKPLTVVERVYCDPRKG